MRKHRPIPIGERFGRWIVTGSGLSDNYGNWHYPCICDCGTVKSIPAPNLRNGFTKSCGCTKKVERKAADHPLNSRWNAMIARCENKSDPKYPIYGGRGISVCPRWRRSFWAFVEDMGECPKGLSLDRINNDGNYEPGNCRWATPHEQQNNQRRTTWIEAFGENRTISDWAEKTGIRKSTIKCRIFDYGWPPEKALTKPPQPWGR